MTDEVAPVEQPVAPAPQSVADVLADAVAAETPAPAFDPEAFKSSLLAEITKQTNDRVSGLQRTFAKQLNEAVQKIAPPAAEDDATDPETKAEIAQLRRKNWILEQRANNPEAADLLLQFAEAESAEDQFKALADFIAAQKAPAPPPPKEAEEDVPSIDLNNPMPGADEDVTVLTDGTRVTKAIEERVLKNLTRWPGT